jgi:hypothetical protein
LWLAILFLLVFAGLAGVAMWKSRNCYVVIGGIACYEHPQDPPPVFGHLRVR